MNRFGPGILVEAAGQKYLFDAGRGALQRLAQLKVRWQKVRWQDVEGVFLTHLHSDHVVGFPDLWLTGWLVGPGRDRPLAVWGPRGTRKMMANLEQAYEFDIRIRLYDDRAAPDGVVILADDVNEGVVLEKGGLKITAFEVDHTPVRPAFGFRVDYGGRSVVLSGDIRVSENLIRQAQGVDLLIHEVASPESFQRAGTRPERARAVIDHHVTPQQAGEVFSRVKPKLAVYSHIVQPDATEQDLVPPTRMCSRRSGRRSPTDSLLAVKGVRGWRNAGSGAPSVRTTDVGVDASASETRINSLPCRTKLVAT
jgi:ribonuclease Z